MKIKVMIVDDQVILSEGIRSVLSSSDELEVIAVAHDGQEALDEMAEGKVPDVMLLDIRMPGMNGVVTTGEVKKKYPSVKVLMLTTFDDSDYILSALNNGACGYLLKDIGANALIEAVKMIEDALREYRLALESDDKDRLFALLDRANRTKEAVEADAKRKKQEAIYDND